VTQEEDGTLTAVVLGRDEQWLVSLILSCGRDLLGVQPPGLAAQAARAARSALGAYERLGEEG